MDIIEYWWEHMPELLGFSPQESEEMKEERIKDWHEHLWDTL